VDRWVAAHGVTVVSNVVTVTVTVAIAIAVTRRGCRR
jgi:hypothetical protein